MCIRDSDNSYSIIPSDLTAAQNQANQGQEIAVFDKENLGSILYTIENNDNTFLVKDGAMSIIDGINIKVPFFYPNMLAIDNYFIPDYWRMPDKINTLRTIGQTVGDNDYNYYNSWQKQIQTSMVFDILSIALRASGGPSDLSLIHI